jgi:hypothetical protein
MEEIQLRITWGCLERKENVKIERPVSLAMIRGGKEWIVS